MSRLANYNDCVLNNESAIPCMNDCSACNVLTHASKTTMLKYQTLDNPDFVEYCCPACKRLLLTDARAVQGDCSVCEWRLFE